MKQKGFITILASFIILALGSVLLYGYEKNSKENINDIYEYINSLENQVVKLGGSMTGTQYGGTGTSSSAWTGLIRVTGGKWDTTTLTDSDVPNDITITTLPNEVSFSSTSITNLTVGTSTFNGISTFNGLVSLVGTTTFSIIPNLPSVNPTTDNQAVRKYYVDNNPYFLLATPAATTTTLRGSSSDTEYGEDTNYALIKEIKIAGVTGSSTVSFELNCSPADCAGSSRTTYAKIYKNGVTAGTERSTQSNTYQFYQEDISFGSEDLIQLYVKQVNGADAYVKNFNIYFNLEGSTNYTTVNN
jgi:hypothetical protein